MSENQLNLLCTIIEEYKIMYERVNSIKVDLPKMELSNNALNLLYNNRALKEFMQSMNIKNYYYVDSELFKILLRFSSFSFICPVSTSKILFIKLS